MEQEQSSRYSLEGLYKMMSQSAEKSQCLRYQSIRVQTSQTQSTGNLEIKVKKTWRLIDWRTKKKKQNQVLIKRKCLFPVYELLKIFDLSNTTINVIFTVDVCHFGT